MMQIVIKFMTLYEPGEYAPPQFELECETHFPSEHIPRYTDRIEYNNKEYFIYNIKYFMEYNGVGYKKVVITATRKVFYTSGENNGESKGL